MDEFLCDPLVSLDPATGHLPEGLGRKAIMAAEKVPAPLLGELSPRRR
jgi:hypothetical protein